MDITLPAYVWRGKTYKTTSGLCRAVDKAHGGACSVSFDREHMYVTVKRHPEIVRNGRYVYDRSFLDNGDSEICDQWQHFSQG